MEVTRQSDVEGTIEAEIKKLKEEIADRERRIDQLQRLRLQGTERTKQWHIKSYGLKDIACSNWHSLLLLSDSALPLGSFAFSSGLESLLSHRQTQQRIQLLNEFIAQSLAAVARLSLPYLLAAHKEPLDLLKMNGDYDACNPCTVARRASVAQGRALVALWEKSFRTSAEKSQAADALSVLSAQLKKDEIQQDNLFGSCAHFSPIFGVTASALGIESRMAAYTFLLSHSKAILSAAVRAGVLGPFQAQAYLTSQWLRVEIGRLVDTTTDSMSTGAGQVWVSGDIWVGRHELLYSRIFNS